MTYSLMTSWPRTEWYILLASVIRCRAMQVMMKMLNFAKSHFAETGSEILWWPDGRSGGDAGQALDQVLVAARRTSSYRTFCLV